MVIVTKTVDIEYRQSVAKGIVDTYFYTAQNVSW